MKNPFRKKRQSENALVINGDVTSTKTPGDPGEENAERMKWGRQVEFTLSLVGYSVGLGNLWRFPYLCMRNGGGAFLIPYFVFLILCGLPLFFLEVAIGQFSGESPLSMWKAIPLFKGLGWGMIAVSGIICVYYNVIISWTLYYLVRSFAAVLPWSNCDNSWNTPGCTDRANITDGTSNEDINTTSIFGNASSLLLNNMSSLSPVNDTGDLAISKEWKLLTPAEEFWQFETLHLSDGIDSLGGIRWQLLLCLIAAWVIVFLCLSRGIKSSGKVIYVTATAPYIFLTIFFIRGLFLPGAVDGIKYYIVPKFEQLYNIRVWGEACLQIFYSLGPAWGGLITMASYNRFHHNCLRDSIMVSLGCCGTSFFAGFVIFSILGFMAKEANLDISEVVTSGPGLVFIAYPEAITKLPISPMWSIFFFLMLFTLGLDSQFATFETMATGLVDEFPRLLKKRKTAFTAFLCFVEFLLGLPLVTKGGMYVFQILDWYAAAFSVIVIAFFECIAMSYVYGLSRLKKDIAMMLGKDVNLTFWMICWAFVTPVCLLSIIIFSMYQWQPPVYGDYHYPPWAITMGWLVAMCSIVPIPGVAIYRILREEGSLLERMKILLRPTDDWGPAIHKTRQYQLSKQCELEQEVPLQAI